jgi:hypothetical protein
VRELMEYASNNPHAHDRTEVLATAKYLTSLNDIFELKYEYGMPRSTECMQQDTATPEYTTP